MSKDNIPVADMQPDELNALKLVVKEFVERLTVIKNEQETLKEDEKALIEEFKEKLDMKTLKAALRVLKIHSQIAHKDTFDSFMEVLTES